MAKLTHLLLLLALIVWLAGSGCVGNSESDMDDERIIGVDQTETGKTGRYRF